MVMYGCVWSHMKVFDVFYLGLKSTDLLGQKGVAALLKIDEFLVPPLPAEDHTGHHGDRDGDHDGEFLLLFLA